MSLSNQGVIPSFIPPLVMHGDDGPNHNDILEIILQNSLSLLYKGISPTDLLLKFLTSSISSDPP